MLRGCLLAKHLYSKCEDPTSTAKNTKEEGSQLVHVYLYFHYWGDKEKKVFGDPWLASPASLVSPRLVKDPVSNGQGS